MSFALSGLASGLDTGQLIQQLMQLERQPVFRLESQKRSLSSEQDIFRSINTKLRTLREAAADLTLSSTFRPTMAESSDESVLTAKTSGNAVHGSYDIEVISTAKRHVLQSNEFGPDQTFASSGTITIDHPSLESSISISYDVGDRYADIMEQVMEQINSSDVQITASIINTSGDQRSLILTSKETGEANKIQVTIPSDEEEALAFTDTRDGSLDAVVKVNGVQVTRSSNEISDVIEGVTLNLHKAGDSASITVGNDMDAILEKIEQFVKAYNDVVGTVRNNLGKEKPLQGDSTLKNLDNQLYRWMQTALGGADAGFRMMSEIGLTIDEGITQGSLMTGTISFDKEKFQSKYEENPEAVINLFAGNDENQPGIARLMNDNLRTWTSAADGLLTMRIQGYDSQISYMDDRLEQMEDRLLMKEQRLQMQFARMEIALAELQNQQLWLNGQLSQLMVSQK